MCRDCRQRTTRDWSIRAYHENQLHERSCWVHPTYAPEKRPVGLSRRDSQLFFKALRNAGHRFRYFGCGEYGSLKGAPHFHIMLFGTDFRSDQYPWTRKNGHLLYRSPSLEKCWPHGHILVGDVTPQSAAYTAGYIDKKLNGRLADEINPETGLKPYERLDSYTGEVVQVKPEFTIASGKPGIGHDWLMKYVHEVYPADTVVMNGREYPVPRYYDKICEREFPQLWEEVKQKRMEFAQANPIDKKARLYHAQAKEIRETNFIPQRGDPSEKQGGDQTPHRFRTRI